MRKPLLILPNISGSMFLSGPVFSQLNIADYSVAKEDILRSIPVDYAPEGVTAIDLSTDVTAFNQTTRNYLDAPGNDTVNVDNCLNNQQFCLDYYSIDKHAMDNTYYEETGDYGDSDTYGGNFYEDWQDSHTLGVDYYENWMTPDGYVVYPSTGLFFIENQKNNITEVRIFNRNGKEVLRVSPSELTSNINIDLTGYPPGAYGVSVSDSHQNLHTGKMVLIN